MAIITTRLDFSNYCLRKLGAPVININVSPEQVSDRVDDALQLYTEKHFDSTLEAWTAYALTQADIDNGYITVPDNILSIAQIANTDNFYSQNALTNFKYQYVMGTLTPFTPIDQIDYFMTMTNFDQTLDMVNVTPTFKFSRHENKLYINTNLKVYSVGYPILCRVFKILSTSGTTKVWNDRWLKSYATVLIKKQWGENLMKHGNIQLLGGITLNGEQIYQQALDEIQKLEEELDLTYQEPCDFFMG